MIDKIIQDIAETGADAYSYLPYIFATIFCKKKGVNPAKYEEVLKDYGINLDFSTPLPLNIKNLLINNDYQFSENISDIYQYLISMKKDKNGQYFTPSCLSMLCYELILQEKQNIQKIYDPTCGAGNMLVNTEAEQYFGQEVNNITAELCKMNLILENKNNFNIINGDTLKNPAFLGERFDTIIGNPPFSLKYDKKQFKDDIRIPNNDLLPPNSNSDLFFIFHALHLLAGDGICTMIMYPGVLYRDKTEKKIREYLINNNYIDTIILTPNDLFLNTSISTVIMILKKNKKDKNILFIDASKEYKRENKKNKMTEENIKNVIDIYKQRKNIDEKSYLASYEEIKNNHFALTPSNYIQEVEEKEEINPLELQKEILKARKRYLKASRELDALIEEIEGIKQPKKEDCLISLF